MSGPLVELWAARMEDTAITDGGLLPYHHAEDAEWRTRKDGGTVVPLIAADRLTDARLVAAVRTFLDDVGDPLSSARAGSVLAALRTHLEQTGADA